MFCSVSCVLLAAVTPLRIVPNKIVYPLNERGYATVVVTNRDLTVGARSRAEVVETWGLDVRPRTIWKGEVSLGPGEGRSFRVDWPGSNVRYGHELRVNVGAETRAEYFNVNDDWWRVCQGCRTETARDVITPGLVNLLDYYGYSTNDWTKWQYFDYRDWAQRCPGMGPFLSYYNMMTRWQMQKSSVGGNAVVATYPDGHRWITPNGSMPRDTGDLRRDVEAAHAWGFHHTRFTINLMEGPYGFELARKKPHFILRNDRGQYQGLYMDAETDPVKIATPDCPLRYPWTYVEPNFFREDAFEWALDDLVKGFTALGEDGVYFDGRYMKKQGYDAYGRNLAREHDVAACVTRNMRRTQEKIYGAKPDAYVWSNGAEPDNPEMALADHPQSGLLLEIQWPFLLNASRQDHSYRGYLEALLKARNTVWQPGPYVKRPSKILHNGYLATRWDPPFVLAHQESFVMSRHIMSILASAAAHPFAGGVTMRPFKQMMTRYSELYWHEDIEVMKDGYKRFSADSMREIWYDDMIYRRETPEFVQYTIHLVNTPEQEYCDDAVTAEPPFADDVEVSTRAVETENTKAWVIRPHGWMSAVLEPECRPVAAQSVNGETTFRIPPFRYYALLVIRQYK